MHNKLTSIWFAVFACGVLRLCADPNVSDAYENAMNMTNVPACLMSSIRDGRMLMQLKGVSKGDSSCKCAAWHRPDSVLLNGVELMVSNRISSSHFVLVGASGAIARGRVEEYENEDEARMWTFSDLADCNATYTTVAKGIRICNVSTNSVFIDCPRDREGYGCLVHKNLSLKLSAETNRMEIAVAFLNAGLSDADKVDLGRH